MTNGNFNTISEAKKYALDVLKNAGIENFNIDVNAALKAFLGADDIFIAANRDYKLNEEIKQKFINFVNLRKENMPLAYILNQKEFMSLNFYVDKSTLIPRPDTEILVEEVIKRCENRQNIKILDLCTGSGAIGISLAKYIENSSVLCVDKFCETLAVAEKNAKSNGVYGKVKLLKCDVLTELEYIGEKFDIVVSNPPYIASGEVLKLEKNVKDFEPLSALDGGCDGLIFYKKIIEEIDLLLKKDGLLAFEIGYDQKKAVTSLMKDKFYDICAKCDLSGNDRVILGNLR